jgi:hypothetical protein
MNQYEDAFKAFDAVEARRLTSKGQGRPDLYYTLLQIHAHAMYGEDVLYFGRLDENVVTALRARGFKVTDDGLIDW